MPFREVCTAKIFIGSGVPGKARYAGYRVRIDDDAFIDTLEDAITREYPGATSYKARGMWRDRETGAVDTEETIVVEIFSRPARNDADCRRFLANAWKVAQGLARIFGQQAVGVIGSDGQGLTVSDFVEQSGGMPWRARAKPRKRKSRSRSA